MNERRPPTLLPPTPVDQSAAPPLYVPPRRLPADTTESGPSRPARRRNPASPPSDGNGEAPRALLPRLFGFMIWLLITLIAFVFGSVLLLRWVPPPTTAFMLQSPLKPVRHLWVPSEHMSDHLRRAVIASEDQKFFAHKGFDFEAIGDALEEQRDGGRRRGASTISQQTAKNLFLWPGGGFFRKGVEAGFTVLIETLWDKPRILEVYLNIAEFGEGIYGVEAAAQTFFGKSAAQLSAEESARLAAVLPSPRRWSARDPGPYVQSRANWILRQIGHGAASTATVDDPEPAYDINAEDRAAEAISEEVRDQTPFVDTRTFDDFEPRLGTPRPITEDEPFAVDGDAPPAEATPQP